MYFRIEEVLKLLVLIKNEKNLNQIWRMKGFLCWGNGISKVTTSKNEHEHFLDQYYTQNTYVSF